MLNINATEKERDAQDAAARREARADVVKSLVFACVIGGVRFGTFYTLMGNWKGAIAFPALIAGRLLISSKGRRFIRDLWDSR
jgi:hypothetical protein